MIMFWLAHLVDDDKGRPTVQYDDEGLGYVLCICYSWILVKNDKHDLIFYQRHIWNQMDRLIKKDPAITVVVVTVW
jgi:hypothetical protein